MSNVIRSHVVVVLLWCTGRGVPLRATVQVILTLAFRMTVDTWPWYCHSEINMSFIFINEYSVLPCCTSYTINITKIVMRYARHIVSLFFLGFRVLVAEGSGMNHL